MERTYEEIKRQHPIPQEMLDRFQRAKSQSAAKLP